MMKINICLLLLSLGLTLMAAVELANAVPDLVVYLMLDEGKGDQVVDASKNGNDGKAAGNFKWVKGKFGQALELAAGAEVQVEDNKTLDGMKALTIAVWVLQDSLQNTGVIQKGANWPDMSYLIQPWSDGMIYFGVKDTSTRAITKAGALPLKEWYHLAGTFDGKSKTLKVYINGEEKASAPAPVDTVPDTVAPLKVGNRLTGSIDDFVLYNRALNADEVKELTKGNILPVDAKGKLALSWGELKKR